MAIPDIVFPKTCARFLLPYMRPMKQAIDRANVLSRPQGDDFVQTKVTDGSHRVGLAPGWSAQGVTLIQNGALVPTQALMNPPANLG